MEEDSKKLIHLKKKLTKISIASEKEDELNLLILLK